MFKIKNKRQIKKNINKNLKFYRTSTKEKGDVVQGLISKCMIIILAICVPVTSVLTTLSILYRMPDFFRYEFNRVGVTSNLSIGITDVELGSFFSKFMLHQNDVFSLVTEFEGEQRELFTQAEVVTMDNFRLLMDMFLIFAIATLLISVFLIIALKYNNMSSSLRISLNIGLGIYILGMAALVFFFNYSNFDSMLLASMMETKFGADDLLQQMFDERFTLHSTVVVCVVSFVIMMIIRYIVWKLTEQKGIFSESLIGAGR